MADFHDVFEAQNIAEFSPYYFFLHVEAVLARSLEIELFIYFFYEHSLSFFYRH